MHEEAGGQCTPGKKTEDADGGRWDEKTGEIVLPVWEEGTLDMQSRGLGQRGWTREAASWLVAPGQWESLKSFQ
jgi:hypothetical protein